MGHGPAPCERVPPLSGFRVGVTAYRRAEEQAELLHRRGAEVLLGAVVCTRPFGDDRALRAGTDAVLARPPDIAVATTGIGIRSWFAAAESWGLDGSLRAALRSAQVVARGPKAAAALVAVGVPCHDEEPSERLDGLVARLVAAGIGGRRVALQLYGEEVPWAIAQLEGAGADTVAVPVYRWTEADDLGPAHRLLDALLAGQLDAVTFTSAAAVRSFALLAEGAGVGAQVRRALSSAVLAACVGPVTDAAAASVGFERRTSPARGRLGLLVRALSRELHDRHRHLHAHGREVVFHGASLWTPGDQVVLSDVERALLAVLTERPGAVISRAVLRQRVWGGACGDAAVDKGISRLRRALSPVGLSVDVVARRGWSVGATEARCPVPATSGPTAD
jgi:uroporphyrinogen-III synthase